MFDTNSLSIASAFAAGMASFLSPCVLPLVPGYVSYIAGQSLPGADAPRPGSAANLGLALLFVAGFSCVFVALGTAASLAGQVLLQYRQQATAAGGALVAFFGLFMLGFGSQLGWLQRDLRFHLQLPGGRPIAAFLLGLAFGFGWTPCIGPVLGAILTVAAVSERVAGPGLLAVYSAGLGVPFLLAAVFTGKLLQRQAILRRISRPLHLVAGGVMVAMGVAMVTGHLADFSFWLLRAFPRLGQVG
ncbi:cytochrome c biogenesis CcdA family protein [Cupriavidus sp. Agwp_2]|uniref:cytochrome c biogenesis CcdA family protein n=1 Tax=Cupriavidus sp. Agwp_2 TaxID=2897324 RepID=UPI00346005A9